MSIKAKARPVQLAIDEYTATYTYVYIPTANNFPPVTCIIIAVASLFIQGCSTHLPIAGKSQVKVD